MKDLFRYRWMAPLALVASMFVVAFTFSESLPANTVTLPINVFPVDGHSDSEVVGGTERVTLTVPDASSAGGLAVRIHQPNYHLDSHGNQLAGTEDYILIQIRLNDGQWVDLSDQNVNCSSLEAKYVHEGYNCLPTVMPSARLRVESSVLGAFQNGENTVDFRYVGTDGVRSGFRVIGIAVTASGADPSLVNWSSAGLATGTTIQYRDYTSMSAPVGANAANGKSLWSQRNILTDWISGSEQPIVASCADCHFKGGGDLWYFNYSNESITARSRFHGLTQQQGEDIAAFIRGVQLYDHEGNAYDAPGTLWDPPFQPGWEYGPALAQADRAESYNTSLTDDESHLWPAGAGLYMVAETDAETAADLWPAGGDPENGVGRYYDSATGEMELDWTKYRGDLENGQIDLKRFRIAVQLPDWNMWLADIAPIDYSDNSLSTPFEQTNLSTLQEKLFGTFNSSDYTGILETKNIYGNRTDRSRLSNDFQQIAINTNSYRGKNSSTGLGLLKDGSVNNWAMVRVLEAHLVYDLFGAADEEFDLFDMSDQEDAILSTWGLDIGMFSRGRHMFNRAAHIIGGLRTEPYADGSSMGSEYYTHGWYEVQTILDPGTHPAYHPGNPNDWQYQDSHMANLCETAEESAAVRMFASEILRQQLLGGANSYIGLSLGWDYSYNQSETYRKVQLRAINPVHALGAYDSNIQANNTSCYYYGNSDPELNKDIVNAYFRSWWSIMEDYPLSAHRAWQCFVSIDGNPPSDDNNCYELATRVPDPNGNLATNAPKMDRWYQKGKEVVDAGAALGIMDTIATQLLAPMWPEGNEQNYQSNNLPYSWSDLAVFSAPASLPAAIQRARGAIGSVQSLTNSWRLRAGAGQAGNRGARFGISDPSRETVPDGTACDFRLASMRRVDAATGSPTGNPTDYHDTATVCEDGDVCVRIYAQGRSASFENVATGQVAGTMIGTVTLPADVAVTCNGTTCSASVDGASFGATLPDPGDGVCAADAVLGSDQTDVRLEVEVQPMN